MYQAHPTCVKVRDLLRKVHRSNSFFPILEAKSITFFEATTINIDPHAVMPFHLTQNMDLARGSKVFPCFSSMEKIRKRSRTPSAWRARAASQPLPPRWRVHRWTPWASNFIRKMSWLPALACPSRELRVWPATQALPTLSTCAKIDSWALQCSADAHGTWRKSEKPVQIEYDTKSKTACATVYKDVTQESRELK